MRVNGKLVVKQPLSKAPRVVQTLPQVKWLLCPNSTCRLFVLLTNVLVKSPYIERVFGYVVRILIVGKQANFDGKSIEITVE